MDEYLLIALPLLKRFEGFRDTVYLDGKGIPTIGYGFTDPELVKKGRISRVEADRRLLLEARKREVELKKKIKNWDNLSNNSKSALLSYYYNYPAGFKDTTKFMGYWNKGDYDSAIKEVDAGMNDPNNPGLKDRRLEELGLLRQDPFLFPQKTNAKDKKSDTYWDNVSPQEIPMWMPSNYTTQYPLNNNVPESISSWSGKDSPSKGPRMPSLLKQMNERKRILDINNYAPEYPKLITSKLNKGKDLPKFYPGKDSELVERGGVVYNVDPSAVGASELNVTVPNINITPSDRPLYQRYDAYNSTYDPNAIRAITDWIPGIGDVSQGFDAVGALNRGDYLNAAMLGAGLVVPKTLSSTAKTALKNLPAERIKQITDNFIKFADKNRSKIARTIKGQDYYNFMNTFGHMLDKSRISVDDVYSGMRGRIKELASTLDPHATYDGENIIRYSENGVPLGTLSLYDDANGYSAKYVGSIVSNKPGVGRKLYDSAINAVGRIITGKDVLSAPKITSIWKHYPTKTLIGRNGKHSNVGMLLELGEDAQKLEEVNNGPVYLLDLPSQYVPTKHAKIFDPTILDNHGNMHIDLQDPSLFKATIPIVGSAALYNSMKDSGILPTQVLTDGLNEYNKGKNIYIKPSKRGTFTAAAKKHGKSVQAFASLVLSNPGKYSKAMRKKALFARNASKWGK